MLRALKPGSLDLFQQTLKSFAGGFAQSTRNTFVLKRRWPLKLYKKNEKPDRLRGRHFVYDLIEDTGIKPLPELEVVLTTFVDGHGQRGDVIKLNRNFAHKQLLLPGLAVYNTPENRERYKRQTGDKEEVKRSSPFVERTINMLERLVIALVMNKDQPWTVEPWHIRVALRKIHIHVPDEAVELPETPITGPDLRKQNKEFIVKIRINNMEEAKVKFRIHHWSTEPSERLPYVIDHWKEPAEPLLLGGTLEGAASSPQPSPAS